MYKELNSEILATVLILDKRLEPQPEPFRGQPDVHFVINFDEYIKFIRSELSAGYNWLCTPTRDLLNLIWEVDQRNCESARKRLFSAFLKDMAFAVMKELCICEALGKGATKITHSTSLSSVVLGPEDYSTYFANVKHMVVPSLLSYLSSNGYTFSNRIERNRPYFDYAVTLLFLSDKQFYWSSI